MHRYNPTASLDENIDDFLEDDYDNNLNNDICFSSDLNKTSLKNINRKNIYNLSNFIGNKSIFEYLMLNKLSNYLIINNNDKILLDKLKYYNKKLDIKNIELCLKIDKTFDYNIVNLKKKISKLI